MANLTSAVREYASVQSHTQVADATPHQLISALLKAALGNIAAAKGAIERRDVPIKGAKLGRAIEIIDNLRAALDMEQGGEIAANLRDLYDFMEMRLLAANIENDVTICDEVTRLLREILLGWEGMPDELKQARARPESS